MQAQQCFTDVPEQLRCRAGAAHAVPLITQSTGDQGQGKSRIALFLGGAIRLGDKLRPPSVSGENTVGVQARRTRLRTLGKRPLLRAELVEQGVADAGHIQVTALSQWLEFIKQLRRVLKGEQARQPRPQTALQALCEIHGDRPIRACFTRWVDGAAHVGNTPLGVGHRAVFFTPTGGGQ